MKCPLEVPAGRTLHFADENLYGLRDATAVPPPNDYVPLFQQSWHDALDVGGWVDGTPAQVESAFRGAWDLRGQQTDPYKRAGSFNLNLAVQPPIYDGEGGASRVFPLLGERGYYGFKGGTKGWAKLVQRIGIEFAFAGNDYRVIIEITYLHVHLHTGDAACRLKANMTEVEWNDVRARASFVDAALGIAYWWKPVGHIDLSFGYLDGHNFERVMRYVAGEPSPTTQYGGHIHFKVSIWPNAAQGNAHEAKWKTFYNTSLKNKILGTPR